MSETHASLSRRDIVCAAVAGLAATGTMPASAATTNAPLPETAEIAVVQLADGAARTMAARMARMIDELGMFGPMPEAVVFVVPALVQVDPHRTTLQARAARLGSTCHWLQGPASQDVQRADLVQRRHIPRALLRS